MDSLLWEFEQQRQIRDAKHQAAAARDDGLRLADTVRMLERRVEKLALISRALWSLLRERTGLTEEQLSKRVTAVDL